MQALSEEGGGIDRPPRAGRQLDPSSPHTSATGTHPARTESSRVERLTQLAAENPYARGTILVVLILFGPMPLPHISDDWHPFSSAFSPEVQGPAVSLLLLGFLLAMDFCIEAVRKVERECMRVGTGLSVSPLLEFSDGAVQDAYHRWLEKTAAVKWHPSLALLAMLLGHLRMATKPECGFFHQVAAATCSALVTLRLILRARGAPVAQQSAVSLASMAIMLCVHYYNAALKDTCLGSIVDSADELPDPVLALVEAFPLFAPILVVFLLCPMTMQHFPVLACIAFLVPTCFAYFEFLHHGGGLTAAAADPGSWGFLMSVSGYSAVCLSVVALRYHIAQANMVSFLCALARQRAE